jgi:hypothetical protein
VQNEENMQPAGDYRSGLGQTAYKRALGYQHLGVQAQDVEPFPFFRANLRRIGRQLNQGRAKDVPLVHPFDVLECSEDDESRRLWTAYKSVPATFRKLLRPEAFCQAARVNPSQALGLIVHAAVRQGTQASALLAAVWHPRVVEKTIQMALTDEGIADRNALHRATGFTPLPKGSTTIVNVQQNAQVPVKVPVPRIEDAIRRAHELFNARGITSARPVTDVVNETAQGDESYKDRYDS